MGLWTKKPSSSEDDSEDIITVSKPRPPPPPPSDRSEPPRPAEVAPKAEPPKVEPPRAPPPPPAAASLPFGIEDAVVLVRQLPTRNTDLVMQVVKKTLESVHVDIVQIIDGATKKEQGIEDRISTLKKEIERLEAQIATSKKEIAQLEAEQKEVTSVKERLLMAQKMESQEPSSDRPVPERVPTGKVTITPTQPPRAPAEAPPSVPKS
jgi:hypothetical protein